MVTLTRLCRPAGVAHATAHPFAVSTLIAATLLAAISAGPAQAQQTQSLSSGADRAPPPAAVTLELPSGPASTPRPTGEVFRIGFLASDTPAVQRERLAPFARHLEGVLDQPVEIVLFREGRGLMMALRRGQMRYAVAPGALVASTQMLCTCIEPLAVQQTITGGTGTFAALAVRADGPVASLEQAAKLDADRVAIVDEGSVVAHRIGLSDLRLDGVGFPEDGAFVFVPSLGRGAAALHAGDVDAVLFWTRQARGDVLTSEVPVHTLDEASRNDLRVVWRSRPALGLTHVVQADLPDEQKDGLQSALVRLIGQNGDAFDAIDGGSGQPFSAISMAELQPYVDAFETWSRQSGQ